LQILANEGVSTKVTFKNLQGEIKNEVQLIWAKNISQKDTRYALQVVLGKLKHAKKYEMGVIAVLKEQIIRGGTKILPLDILEPTPSTPEGKILKWKAVKNWCENPDTSQWAKYDAISPKHFRVAEGKENYHVIGEFLKDESMTRLIEVMLWTTEDVNTFVGEDSWQRDTTNLEINKGNNIIRTTWSQINVKK
jgi:hypothetical protein